MAESTEYQALYRRYRPQRFDELRGQDHVARALKNAVANDRVGHAYLFSGPRGTGKTTTARILAKVLNCEATVDGEPCCACPSCLAVQSGSSFDVIELDAASNRSIEDIREIIATAALGSPGRHKVYILDEVHQLTAPAAAALLKTLEEPPSHVVFVLATTDPEKVPETIRSRTQHLQFHLLPVDDLEKHVKWVAADAGIDIDERGLESVLRRGGGSARDTLSALELLAATGGALEETTPVDEFVEALIEHDAGRLLAAVAQTVYHGRDPRTIVDDLVRHLRDCFLTQMAPELVQVQQHRAELLADQSRRLGTARVVESVSTRSAGRLTARPRVGAHEGTRRTALGDAAGFEDWKRAVLRSDPKESRKIKQKNTTRTHHLPPAGHTCTGGGPHFTVRGNSPRGKRAQKSEDVTVAGKTTNRDRQRKAFPLR
jgi:DNA polymerase-3 subunit gamma/tau